MSNTKSDNMTATDTGAAMTAPEFAPETVTFGGVKMTRAGAVGVMRAAGRDQAYIDGWLARNAPSAAHATEEPTALDVAPVEIVTDGDAPATAPETVTDEPATEQEQVDAPAPMPAAWQAHAATIAAETDTDETDTPAPLMASGMWFWMELHGDRPRVTIAEPTGAMRGIFGSNSCVPMFCALDENGGRHEVCEHDIGHAGIGGLTPCNDRDASTPEDWKALRVKGEIARAKAQADREQIEAERAARRAAMPAQYPTLKTVTESGKSGPVTGAANIKRELRAAFPGVAFSVTCRHYTSIDIHWEDGPTSDQVGAITGKYEEGRFDGMTDCYEHDHDNVFPDVFGGAQYVFEHRSDTLSGVRRAWQLAGHNPEEVKADARGKFDRAASNGCERYGNDGAGDRMFHAWAETDLCKTVTDNAESDTHAPEQAEATAPETVTDETENAPEQAQEEGEMTEEKIMANLADALESIAQMPVYDAAAGVTIAQVVNAYHEALKIARDAVAFYERANGEAMDAAEPVQIAPVCPVDEAPCDGCHGVRAPCPDAAVQIAQGAPEAATTCAGTPEDADASIISPVSGPWSYEKDGWGFTIGDAKTGHVKGNHNYKVADIHGNSLKDEANARLISAAPELLDACDDADTAFMVLNIGSDEPMTPQARCAMREAWEKVKSAMAKATGRE